MMPELTFNREHGYLEGLLRGFKSGILKQADYLNLIQCETLDGRLFKCNEVSVVEMSMTASPSTVISFLLCITFINGV